MDLLSQAAQTISAHIPPPTTIVVGLSGGIDSAVSAALLQHCGYDVIGIFMNNWEEEGPCPAQQDAQDVAKIATILNIPFYTINFAQEYRENVFKEFLLDLQQGYTPNPDILCNREVKFKLLLDKALSLGAAGLATGHYAKNSVIDGIWNLERPRDSTKDQTYFLYTATQYSLSKTIFPLASIPKTMVRSIAAQLQLPIVTKKESTGICFIGERNFQKFISPFLGEQPGNIVNTEGHIMGQHIGLPYYTIGQRKGLRIGGAGEPWFVVHKDMATNTLIIAQGENHPALFATTLTTDIPHWIGNPPSFPYRCTAKIRYRQPDQDCTVYQLETGALHVVFDQPQRAITPKQSIVFYHDTICCGGAFIKPR